MKRCTTASPLMLLIVWKIWRYELTSFFRVLITENRIDKKKWFFCWSYGSFQNNCILRLHAYPRVKVSLITYLSTFSRKILDVSREHPLGVEPSCISLFHIFPMCTFLKNQFDTWIISESIPNSNPFSLAFQILTVIDLFLISSLIIFVYYCYNGQSWLGSISEFW